jgi:hypothetical protein
MMRGPGGMGKEKEYDVGMMGCRLMSTTPEQVMASLHKHTGKKKLQVMMFGTSRLRYLSLDLLSLVEPFGWKYNGRRSNGKLERDFGPSDSASVINFYQTVPLFKNGVRYVLDEQHFPLDPDTFLVFVFSYGLWNAAADGNRSARQISPNDYQVKMKRKLKDLMALLATYKLDRNQYRIIWVSNAATHAAIPARGEEAGQPSKLPSADELPDIVDMESRTELAQANPNLHVLRDVYEEHARSVGDAYVPLYEVTVSARDDYFDHIHFANNRTSGVVASNMILTTMRQLFDEFQAV